MCTVQPVHFETPQLRHQESSRGQLGLKMSEITSWTKVVLCDLTWKWVVFSKKWVIHWIIYWVVHRMCTQEVGSLTVERRIGLPDGKICFLTVTTHARVFFWGQKLQKWLRYTLFKFVTVALPCALSSSQKQKTRPSNSVIFEDLDLKISLASVKWVEKFN